MGVLCLTDRYSHFVQIIECKFSAELNHSIIARNTSAKGGLSHFHGRNGRFETTFVKKSVLSMKVAAKKMGIYNIEDKRLFFLAMSKNYKHM